MEKSALEIQNDCNDINWPQVLDLFESVKWKKRNLDEAKSSFEKSSHKCFIKYQNQIIGFGRTVDDGVYYGLIADVAVHPDYQGQGLGTLIVDNLKAKMKGYLFITLTAAPGKDEFYTKLGWKRQKSAFLWPINEQQESDHCF
jgi:GNAT superfamily N-acetyltransferase